MLTEELRRIMRGGHLAEEEMARCFGEIMDGKVSPVQMAAFLVALRIKGETVDEICGAARAMRLRMTPVHSTRRPLMDTCGTGGDGAHTFNISTAVAFTLAACGVAVAKHGNRAVSSRSGSADVLQALGVDITATKEVVEACISELGIGFLFAPAMHPAMANAGPVRRELGVRTVFNVLGPLTNPAGATHQLLGVFDRSLLRPIAAVLGKLGSSGAWVVHGADGLDEVSLCDTTFVAEWNGESVVEHQITPEDAGLQRAAAESLAGGDAQHNAQLMRQILGGKLRGPLAHAVALNTGAALCAARIVSDIKAGVARSSEILQRGTALQLVDRLVEKTQQKA